MATLRTRLYGDVVVMTTEDNRLSNEKFTLRRNSNGSLALYDKSRHGRLVAESAESIQELRYWIGTESLWGDAEMRHTHTINYAGYTITCIVKGCRDVPFEIIVTRDGYNDSRNWVAG